jgi:hypothetical protein
MQYSVKLFSKNQAILFSKEFDTTIIEHAGMVT